LKLPSEILYHSTNCTNTTHLAELETKFQTNLLYVIRLHDTCSLNPKDCVIDDVTTFCRTADTTARSRGTASVKTRHRRTRQYSHSADSRQRRKVDPSPPRLAAESSNTRATGGRSRGSAAGKTTSTVRYDINSRSEEEETFSSRFNDDASSDAETSVTLKSSNTSETLESVTAPVRPRTVERRSTVSPSPKRLQFVLSVKFHFATRLPSAGGDWPDEYHRASHRLFSLFDYIEQQIVGGMFSLTTKVQSLRVQEVNDSLTYAPLKTICDLGYEFNIDILLCGGSSTIRVFLWLYFEFNIICILNVFYITPTSILFSTGEFTLF